MGARFCILRFIYRAYLGGRGATPHSKIYNIFLCDISLLTNLSNRLVSHFYKSLLLCDYINMRALLILLFCNYVNAQTLCDSLSFNISSGSVLTVVGFNNSSDSVNFMWGVCDKNVCYSASGDTASFPLLNPLDTVKVCYDISPQWTCSSCSYVVFTGFMWQIVNTITHVNEIQALPTSGKMYDILGRELKRAPINRVYIKNGVKYFFTM